MRLGQRSIEADAASLASLLGAYPGFGRPLVLDVRNSGLATSATAAANVTAIHAARDKAASGGVLVFYPGTYKVTRLTASVADQAWVLLEGATLQLEDATNDEMIRVTADSWRLIGPGILDGNKANQTPVASTSYADRALIRLRVVDDARIEGVTLQNGVGHVVVSEGCIRPRVVNCTMLANEGSGVGFVGDEATDGPSNDGVAANNIIVGMAQSNQIGNNGIFVDGGYGSGIVKNFTITGNVIRDCRNGIAVEQGAKYVTVSGNVLDGNAWNINVSDGGTASAWYVTINANVVANGRSNHGINVTWGRSVVISNNVVYNNYGHGINVDGGASAQCQDTIIKGNLCELNRGHGILVEESLNTTVEGNTCKNNGRAGDVKDGIRVSDDNTTINQHVILEGNRCYDDLDSTQNYGIYIAGSPDYLTIIGNDVVGNVTAGLRLAGTNVKISRNLGFVTENKGTATVTSGNTSVTVTHGLDRTPASQDIQITPTNGLGNAAKFWMANIGAATFDIVVDQDPGAGTATFAWQIHTI